MHALLVPAGSSRGLRMPERDHSPRAMQGADDMRWFIDPTTRVDALLSALVVRKLEAPR